MELSEWLAKIDISTDSASDAFIEQVVFNMVDLIKTTSVLDSVKSDMLSITTDNATISNKINELK